MNWLQWYDQAVRLLNAHTAIKHPKGFILHIALQFNHHTLMFESCTIHTFQKSTG